MLFPYDKQPTDAERSPVEGSPQQMDVEDAPVVATPVQAAAEDIVKSKPPPSLFIHTSSETFLIYPQVVVPRPLASEQDKENGQAEGVWRYTIAVVTHSSLARVEREKDAPSVTDVSPSNAPAASSKEGASEEGEDMSISPDGSSKQSVNGDVEAASKNKGRAKETGRSE